MINRRSTTDEEHTIEVNEGDSFQLPECEASNIYPPAFHWLFNSVLDPQVRLTLLIQIDLWHSAKIYFFLSNHDQTTLLGGQYTWQNAQLVNIYLTPVIYNFLLLLTESI